MLRFSCEKALLQGAVNTASRAVSAKSSIPALEGILLEEEGKVLAVTVASRLSEDTFDVHFEKAFETVEGAYAAVNCEMARFLRLRHPEVRFLNREDDIGLEGLRKAKLDYHPHHMVEKYRAFVMEDFDED